MIEKLDVVIIGGGAAGLMTADVLSATNLSVAVFDAMPSVGRKLLQAGVGGLNITHSEDYQTFCTRYDSHQLQLQPILDQLPPDALRSWVHQLGIKTFVGSSGRVFPEQMKAAPFLRAWLHRLEQSGVHFYLRHQWLGWTLNRELQFLTPHGEIAIKPRCTVLALGGASWPQLGSNGAWVTILQTQGVQIAPLQSANCGFETTWSPYLREKFAGSPLKSVEIALTDSDKRTLKRRGELIISEYGVEGSLIYTFSRMLREQINCKGQATFILDLLPNYSIERLVNDLACPRGSKSLSSHLKSRLGLSGIKTALLHEILSKHDLNDGRVLAHKIKSLPMTVYQTRPIAEAISVAGGVCFSNLNSELMLKRMPGVFVAGEMLDWEAPTGGYLLNACFATGWHVGVSVCDWLNKQPIA
jgi:uncharacterized flavoprotein (TIGR03862 family)